MKTIYFLLGLLVFMSCEEAVDQFDHNLTQVSKDSSPVVLYFSGKIGEYPVFMTFLNGTDIEGQYRYTSGSSYLRLKGVQSEDGQYTISEFNGKGVVTGVFRGSLDDKGTFSGFWENQLNEKPKLYFEMEPTDQRTFTSQNEMHHEKRIATSSNSDSELKGDSFSGKYEYLVGGNDAPTGSIEWSFTFKGPDFSFEGKGSEECGILTTKGTGRLVSANVGEGHGRTESETEGEDEMSVSTCQFTFEFTPNSVIVQQRPCEGLKVDCIFVSLDGTIPKITQ